jgi:hypothetical protein
MMEKQKYRERKHVKVRGAVHANDRESTPCKVTTDLYFSKADKSLEKGHLFIIYRLSCTQREQDVLRSFPHAQPLLCHESNSSVIQLHPMSMLIIPTLYWY